MSTPTLPPNAPSLDELIQPCYGYLPDGLPTSVDEIELLARNNVPESVSEYDGLEKAVRQEVEAARLLSALLAEDETGDLVSDDIIRSWMERYNLTLWDVWYFSLPCLRRIATRPHTPPQILTKIASFYPASAAVNPVLPTLVETDPGLFQQFLQRPIREFLALPYLPASVVELIATGGAPGRDYGYQHEDDKSLYLYEVQADARYHVSQVGTLDPFGDWDVRLREWLHGYRDQGSAFKSRYDQFASVATAEVNETRADIIDRTLRGRFRPNWLFRLAVVLCPAHAIANDRDRRLEMARQYALYGFYPYIPEQIPFAMDGNAMVRAAVERREIDPEFQIDFW